MSLKAEVSSRVSDILEDPQNSPQLKAVLLKMGKLLAKKKSLENDVPIKVVDRLWIGNYHFANCRSFLQQNGIQNVVSCLEFDLSLHLQQINYVKMPLKDGHDERFEQTVFEFCNLMRNTAGIVYLHCFSGLSRSAALLLAFLISSQKQTYSQALQSLRSINPKAQPNSYFLSVLQAIAPKLLESSPHQAPATEPKEESVNLLDHIQQHVPSPQKSQGKIAIHKTQNEENLLGFQANHQHPMDNEDLLTLVIDGASNRAQPPFNLPSINASQLNTNKQPSEQLVVEVEQNTFNNNELLDIDLSPKKEATGSAKLLLESLNLEQQPISKEGSHHNNDLLDLGLQPSPQNHKAQLSLQKQQPNSKQPLDYEKTSTSQLSSVPSNLQSMETGELIFLPLTVQKTQVQDMNSMEVQLLQEPTFGSSFLPAQPTPKQEEETATGEKQEQFAESNNFTQKKVKKHKKKR